MISFFSAFGLFALVIWMQQRFLNRLMASDLEHLQSNYTNPTKH